MPYFVECLLNIKEYRWAVLYLFEGLADIVCYSVDLFYCGMLLPKTELMIWQGFQIL